MKNKNTFVVGVVGFCMSLSLGLGLIHSTNDLSDTLDYNRKLQKENIVIMQENKDLKSYVEQLDSEVMGKQKIISGQKKEIYDFEMGDRKPSGKFDNNEEKYIARQSTIKKENQADNSGKVTQVSNHLRLSKGKWRKVRVNASAYTAYKNRKTAIGIKPYWGGIAVDPRYIPLGSKVYIPKYNKTFTAVDTGGIIKGYKIDIYMNSRKQALNFGRRNITVYVKR